MMHYYFIRWSLIAGRLPGRTDNEVKNYWNSHLRRKLISMGIDPDNHRLSKNSHPPAKSQVVHKVKAATLLEGKTSSQLPDLNLHLTNTNVGERRQQDIVSNIAKQTEGPSPELLLFR